MSSLMSSKVFSRPVMRSPIFQQMRTAVCTNIKYNHRISKDPIESYRAKLEQKAKEVGAKNIDELKEKLKDKIEEKKRDLNTIDPLAELEKYERDQALKAQENASKQSQLRSARSPDTPQKPYKTLNSFVDISKVSELPLKELELVWRARFQHKDDTLLSVIPSGTFDKLYQNARENPIFVLPLPREDGTELHYIQWSFVGPNTIHCMFTTLLEFKTHKEFARPHTSLIFHSDLKDAKGVVLMNGVVEKESAITLAESQLLLLNIQRFYGALADTAVSKRRLKLLRDFTSGSSDFNIDHLIEEAQSLEN